MRKIVRLIEITHTESGKIIPVSSNYFSQELGVSRQRVHQILTLMKERKIIDWEDTRASRRYTVLDKKQVE